MIKKLSAVVVAAALCGCTADGWEVTKAYEVCSVHRGVDSYTPFTHEAVCIDGQRFLVHKEID